MKLRRIFLLTLAPTIFVAAEIFAAGISPTNGAIATPPVYVPDISHQNDVLPEGIFAWNMLMATTNISADADKAHFLFSFTNVAASSISILDVHPSCGCTTAELPPLPWTIPAGGKGTIPVTVDVAGKSGILFKSINIATDKGSKDLYLRITIEPVQIAAMSEAQREQFDQIAKVDRQAVFKNNCADCHVKHGEGKYGMALYQADCAICHEANPRATMVPDLHNLKIPTNPDFWKQWIAHGKAGSFMPAFSTAESGPLNDMQIASLVAYLNLVFPPKVPSPQ